MVGWKLLKPSLETGRNRWGWGPEQAASLRESCRRLLAEVYLQLGY